MNIILQLGRPRELLNYLLEGGIIFSVLYFLASYTTTLDLTSNFESQLGTTSFAGLLFLTGHIVIGKLNTEGARRRKREMIFFTAFCAVSGVLAYVLAQVIPDFPAQSATRLMMAGAVVVPIVVVVWRSFTNRFHILSDYRQRVLILGVGETAREACRSIVNNHSEGYSVVGFAARDEARIGEPLAMGARVHTGYDRLGSMGPGKVDMVLVALDEKRGELPIDALLQLRMSGVKIQEAVSFFEQAAGKIDVGSLLPSWLIFGDGFKVSHFRAFLKRMTDIIHSVVLLVMTAPIMLVTAVLIRLDGSPVLYRQTRTGKNGKPFKILKFRSMAHDAEKEGPTWAAKNDSRITKVGAVIRMLRIDELPQLINVLKGEMSFVGPRPERPEFTEKLAEQVPYFPLRLSVRPGITGWAQVMYGYGANVEENREKLKYDLFYIKNGNIFLDSMIVLKTIWVVLTGSGSR
jgi:sugar transferase (PEP-CTERM system associated)